MYNLVPLYIAKVGENELGVYLGVYKKGCIFVLTVKQFVLLMSQNLF